MSMVIAYADTEIQRRVDEMESEWIKVGDGLPEIDEIVMVCYPSGYDGKPVYNWGARLDEGDGWLWGCCSGRSGIRLGESVTFNDIEADDDYPVTAWQRLPAPPR